MNWRDGFETPQNFSEMLRIEARWVRQNYSSLTARYLEQAADAAAHAAADAAHAAAYAAARAAARARFNEMVNEEFGL